MVIPRETRANVDAQVVAGFGEEWRRFDHSHTSHEEERTIFESYFHGFPWHLLPSNAVGFDLGCGSGRWARFVAPRVGRLHCIDPSGEVLEVARRNLAEFTNCEFHCAAVDGIPLADVSANFGYVLGVLHHVPDTQAGIAACARKLKPGAPFLLYLYYAFDNRPWWFRALWRFSILPRLAICRMPFWMKSFVCDVLAALVYWPLARKAKLLERMGFEVRNFPLAAYRNRSFYQMRNDALDRFGTRVEKRFTRSQMESMMQQAGLERVEFSESVPYWCAVGYKAEES